MNNILELIKEKEPVSFKELLGITKSKDNLISALKELEQNNLIFQYKNNFYNLEKFPEEEGYSQHNINGFCWISKTDTTNDYGISFDPSQIFLPVNNKKNAHYGSPVKYKKITIEQQEFAQITKTIQKKNIKLLAIYNQKENQWTILNSNSAKTFTNKLSNIKNNQISIFDSKTLQHIEDLGLITNKGIESQILIKLGDIKDGPENQQQYETVKSKPIKKPFYTIDAISTKDIDDAIWIEKNNLGYHLFVAIADLSSYIKNNDPLDLHAKEACTSFYLPHKTIHMLNRELAENYCSLNPGSPKSAMICEIQFDENGNQLHNKFYQAEITSTARLTYNDVDLIINDQPFIESTIIENNSNTQFKKIKESLLLLHEFSLTRKQDELQKKYFAKQTEFVLNEKGKIKFIYEKEQDPPSQKMVESAMLSANMAAAKFLYDKYPKFGIFRNQFKPETDLLPKPAFYDFNNIGHWGLQTDYYTHFTSPIRRYCDLLVHRLIKNILAKEDKIYSNEELLEITKQINIQQYKSKQFSIKSKILLTSQYLEDLIKTNSFDEKIKIIDFSENGIIGRNKQNIDLFIPKFKISKELMSAIEDYSDLDDKEIKIQQLNNDFKIFVKIFNFTWTDQKKDLLCKVIKNQYKPKQITQ
jgi:ribonuclease R